MFMGRIGLCLSIFLASMPLAQASVLDFEGPVCEGGVCANSAFIAQTYGDEPNLDIQYRMREDFGSTAEVQPSLKFFPTGYGSLNNVVFIDERSVGEIAFIPSAGFKITLQSFDIGVFNSGQSGTIAFYGANFEEIDVPGVSGQQTFVGTTTFMPELTVEGPLYLQWGAQFDASGSSNLGLDNVNYTLMPVAPIPVPAAGWLTSSVVVAFAAARRRFQANDPLA